MERIRFIEQFLNRKAVNYIMANENIQSTALSEGVEFMEKSLDTMLAEQRKTAHNAIDMDDWNKAEEILAKAKTNIKNIEILKTKFAEFKVEAVTLGFLLSNKTAAKSAAEVPIVEAKSEPGPATKPEPKQETKQESESEPKPESKPEPKPQPKPEPKPQPKPEPKPQPKPEPKPQPKPEPKPQPKTEPKPDLKIEFTEHRNSEANPNILDMEMSDFDTEPDTPNPIVNACENLITKFPFSMRLIYSNEKIGKFFTTDDVIAENDMNKPKQLSNGLWVETGIPEERVPSFIRSITRYCEESVNI